MRWCRHEPVSLPLRIQQAALLLTLFLSLAYRADRRWKHPFDLFWQSRRVCHALWRPVSQSVRSYRERASVKSRWLSVDRLAPPRVQNPLGEYKCVFDTPVLVTALPRLKLSTKSPRVENYAKWNALNPRPTQMSIQCCASSGTVLATPPPPKSGNLKWWKLFIAKWNARRLSLFSAVVFNRVRSKPYLRIPLTGS